MSCLCDLDMKHIALHLALTFMKISLVVYRKKMFLGQIHICLSKCTVQHLSVKIGFVCF